MTGTARGAPFHSSVEFVRLGDLTLESTERNVGQVHKGVRSVTNRQELVPTNEYFENARTSADTSQYKIVRSESFAYNPSRINVGSIAVNWEDDPVVVSPMYVVFGVNPERLNSRYLALFLSSSLGRRLVASKTQVGARFRLTYESLAGIRMPVPPLEYQHRIVDALTQFRELETQLITELQARKRQYAFYREALFAGPFPSTELKQMGEVGLFTRGRRFTREDVVEGGIPSIHYGEIYTHYGVATNVSVRQVREELRPQLRFALPGDVVIASVGETVEDVGKAVAWLGGEPVAIHDDTFAFRHSLNAKFVSYWMQTESFHSQKNRHVTIAKIKRLSSSALASILMPVPPMDEQERIVEKLDKFDALVNDLSIGLPAEIIARRKQYEYYRDKLLTFEEAPA